MIEVVILSNQLNYSVWGLVHVWWCYWRVGVLAHCMQLITFLKKRKSTTDRREVRTKRFSWHNYSNSRKFWSNESSMKDVFDHISKHWEEIWKYDAQWGMFDELRGVWKCGQALSWGFGRSSQSSFARRLVLTERQKVTYKRPITTRNLKHVMVLIYFV